MTQGWYKYCKYLCEGWDKPVIGACFVIEQITNKVRLLVVEDKFENKQRGNNKGLYFEMTSQLT